MPRRRRTAALAPWAALALRSGETLVAASQVIPVRLARMAAAGPNPSARDRREMARMGTEKLAAGTQSLFAVALQLQAQQVQWMARAWQGWLGLFTGAGAAGWARLGGAALAPVHRTATANARRLSRGKPRRRSRPP